MSTIDTLAKIDTIATRIIGALRRGVEWVEDKYEDCLVEATYKAVEYKAAAIDKIEDKISDLEDEQAEAAAAYIEAKAKLRADFQRLVESLDNAQAKAEADVQDKLASAALALVAAHKAYDGTIQAADEKLGVRVEA